MAENWTIWPNYNSGAGGSDGDGPRIGIYTSTSQTASAVTINYAFYLQGRNNYTSYGIWGGWTTTWSGYIPNVGTVSGSTNGVWRGIYKDTLKSGSVTISRGSSDQSVSFSLSINGWGGATWNNSTGGATSISASVTIPKINQLAAPTISTSLGIIKPENSNFNISWSSVSNASSYGLYVKDNAGNIILNDTQVSSTSYALNIESISNYRGRNIIAYVYAKGNSNYVNSSVSSKTIMTINALPAAPAVTSSGNIVDATVSINFQVTAGSDSNSSQTRTLYYSLGTSEKKLFTSPLKISLDNAGDLGIEKAGTYTINFYTYDGLEFSSLPTSKTFTINFAPTFVSNDQTYTYVNDGYGNQTLVSQAILSFILQANITSGLSVKLFAKSSANSDNIDSSQEVEVPATLYKINIAAATKTITINIGQIPDSIIKRGNYFKFSYEVSDSVATSDRSKWTISGRKPLQRSSDSISNVSIINDATGIIPSLENYFKEKLYLSFTNPKAEEGYPDISTMEIIVVSNENQDSYQVNSEEGKDQKYTLTLSSILENKEVEIYLKLVDIADQVTTSKLLGTYTKTSQVSFANQTIYLSKEEIKPLSNSDNLQISHSLAQASGTLQKDIEFSYVFFYNNKNLYLDKNKIKTIQEQDTIYVTIGAEYLKELSTNLTENAKNIKASTTIKVIAKDGFDATKQITANIILNFTEPPILPNLNFRIGHDYQIKNNQAPEVLGRPISNFLVSDNESYDLDLRMFNAKEGVIFWLPIAADENDDITEYEIQLSRNSFEEIYDVITDTSKLTFTPWVSIPIESLKLGKQDNNYYYYRYKASDYTKNEYYYFKLRVRDSQGNYSEEKISETFIIGCRTVMPRFTVGDVKVTRGEGQNGIVTLQYDLKITDLGGSATSDGWNKDYYNKYPNFERTFEDGGKAYQPKIYLTAEISPDQTFKTDVYPKTLQIVPGGSPLLDYKQTRTDIEGFPSSESKIYIRFILTVSYGFDSSKEDGLAIVSSVPTILSYFGSVPTMAHRKHKVGINTTSLKDEDVFVIENYQESRYVVFRGTDPLDASKTYEIKLDLLQGTVEGATIVCGEWI